MPANLFQHIRIQNWWQFKIAPLIAIFFLGALSSGYNTPIQHLLVCLCCLLVWMFGTAGLGYFINDWADIEEDAKSGKANSVAAIAPVLRLLITFLLTSVALSALYLVAGLSIAFFLGLLQILLFAVYSFPPIRLKRFVIGIIVLDSLYAHLLPSLIVFMVATGGSKVPYWYTVLLVLWQAMAGVRNIVLHHIAARYIDRKAGSANITNTCAPKPMVQLINKVFYIPEVLTLLLFAHLVGLSFGIALLLLFSLHWYVVLFKWGHRRHGFTHYNSTYLFLNNFYEQYLPVVSIIFAGAVLSHSYLLILIPFTLLFPAYLKTLAKDVSAVLR